MFTYSLDQLSEIDQLITSLADQSLTEPLRKRSVSCQQVSVSINSSVSRAAVVPLLEPHTPSNNTRQKKYGCWVALVFTGQFLLTGVNSIPLLLYTASAYTDEPITRAGLTLTVPLCLSLLDTYISTYSAVKAMNELPSRINQHVLHHASHGFPTRIRIQPTARKRLTCISFFRILGSLYQPICYAFTAAQVLSAISDCDWVTVPAFILNLVSSLLESHMNHSFFLLSFFVSRRSAGISISPNGVQDSWIRFGCWLNEKRRWLHGLTNLSVIATGMGIPSYFIQATDSWPNHLYFAGLIGLAISTALAQIHKNHRLIQAQNRLLSIKGPCAEKTRMALFDRPELAWLWQFASRLNPGFMALFSIFSLLLLALPLLDQFSFSPTPAAYHADTAIFSFGVFLFIAVMYSAIQRCKPKISEQVAFSAWESMGLACSASALLALIADNSDFSNDSSAIKIASFLAIYAFSSLLVTSRDNALYRVQTSNLFWQQPAARERNRRQAKSDGVLYERSGQLI